MLVAYNQLRMRVLLQKDHLKHNLHPLLLTLVKYLLSHRLTHLLLTLVNVPIESYRLTPYPLRPSSSTIIPDSIPKNSGGNLGGHLSSDKSILGNEGEMTLQSVYDLIVSLYVHKIRSSQINTTLEGSDQKDKKQAKPGMKFAKGKPSVQRDPLFDEIPEDTLDHMETENAQIVGGHRDIECKEKVLKIILKKEALLKRKATQNTYFIQYFWNEETIAKVLLNMSQAKQFLESRRKKAEEEVINSIESDEDMARKYNEEGKARIKADRLLAEKLQEEEREKFTIEERASLLQDEQCCSKTNSLLNKDQSYQDQTTLTKNQVRNQMMTLLEAVVNIHI
ncbi:hypothetical protein Tco_1274193 [Tanacetum coccineum]